MNKNKKKFSCPYCGFEFLRGSRGYGNHLRARHPEEYSMGLRLYAGQPAATWPFIVIHPSVRDNAPRATAQVIGLDSDLEDLVKIGNGVNGCWSVTFNPKSDPDPVNHPPHYTFGKYEVIDVLQDWFATNPLLWQVAKYIARADHKGNPVQDLEKAKFYLEREIQRRKEAAATTAATPDAQT